MRLKVVCCDVFEREVRLAIVQSRNDVDLELLPSASHQFTDGEMKRAVQSMVDQNNRGRYHALLLVAGSCKARFWGVEARSIPLVLPRAKDCISLVLDGRTPFGPTLLGHPRTFDQQRGDAPESSGSDGPAAAPSFWMVPVHEGKAIRQNAGLYAGRQRSFNLRGRCPQRCYAPVHASSTLLQRMVDGYWDYQQFLVAAPGWRLTVDSTTGLLITEEVK